MEVELIDNSKTSKFIPKRSSDSIKKDKKNKLLFMSVKEITFWMFLKQTIFFASNYVLDRFPFIFIYILYNIKNRSDQEELLGFCFTQYDNFNVLVHDYQEAVGIILGPHYIRKNWKQYKLNIQRMIVCNVTVFILIGSSIILLYKPMYKFIGLDPLLIDTYVNSSIIMSLTINFTITTTNFIRGKINKV